MDSHKKLPPAQREELLRVLEVRFGENPGRHKGIEWAEVHAKLGRVPEKLWPLSEMERTGGEPDMVGYDKKTGEYLFYDCSAESPAGRRNVCYDGKHSRPGRNINPQTALRIWLLPWVSGF